MKNNLIIGFFLFLLSGTIFSQNSIVPSAYDQSRSTGWNTAQYEAWTYTRVVNSSVQKLPFRMLKPKNWNPTLQYPLVIMLHGRGEAGTENNYQLYWAGQVHQDAVNMVNGVTFPGFVVFPQEPFGQWTNHPEFAGGDQVTTALAMVFDLVDSMKTKFNVDPNKIYVHGLSSGGSGTWACLYNRPDLFAAALPISTPGDTTQASKICSIPIWLTQGGEDTNPIPYISHLMMAALRKAGAVDTNLTKYHEYPLDGHSCWNETYYHKDFFPYMLRQSKLNITMLGSPSLCPNGKVDLSVTPTPNPKYSSNVYQFQWYFNGSSITGANTNRLYNVSVAGSYYVSVKKNSTTLGINTNPVVITTSPATAAPTIKMNNSIYLPAPSGNSVILSGPDGQKSYLWSNGSTAQSISINTSGIFTLNTTPQIGCPSNPSDPVTVRVGPNAANPPLAATNLYAYPTSSQGIIVQWQDNASNELGYELYRGLKKGGPYSFVTVVGANSTSAIDNNLAPFTTYYYRVRSVNADGGTLSLEETRATTTKDFVPPTDPIVSISGFSPSIFQLSWSASFDSSGIKNYYVYNRDTLIGTTDTTFLNLPFTSIKPGSFNNFRVVAQDNGGNYSNPSNEIPFANNGRGLFASYYEGIYTVLPDFTTINPKKTGLVTRPSVNTTTPLVINTLTGQDFPSATTNFALKFDGYINITATGTYTFYTTSDDGSKLWINGTQVVNNDYLQGMTERSGTYNFTTKGWYPISVAFFQQGGGYGLNVNYQGPGISKVLIPTNVLSYFATGTVSGVLAPPTQNISLTGVNYYPYSPNDKPRIKLQWSAISSTFTGVVRGYEVYRIPGSSSPGMSSAWQKITTVKNTIPSNQYSYIDTTDSPGQYLKTNTKYWYAVKAITTLGNTGYIGYTGSVSSPVFPSVTVPTTTPGAMTTPSNLSATGFSNSIVSLKWNDNSNNESGFEVWRSYTKNGIFVKTTLVPRNYKAYNDSTCEANTKYVYKIRAYNAGGFSAFSNLDSTYTLNIPTAPSNLKATTVGPTVVNLVWVDNSDLAFGYSIFRSTSLTSGFSKIDSIPNPVLTFYQDKSAIANTKYYYKIRAFNANPSAFSNIDSAVTLLSQTPSTLNWRLPAVSVTSYINGNQNLMNNIINQNKFSTALLTKTDFFNFLVITPTGYALLKVKLPPVDSMPRGGFMTFNLSRGVNNGTPKGDSLTVNATGSVLLDFNYFVIGPQTYNELSFSVSCSISPTDTSSWINLTSIPTSIQSNYLQKIDFPSSLAGRWLKINFTSNKTGNANFFLSEMGMYRILPVGNRHNYFLLLGASIEQQTPFPNLAKFRERLAVNGITSGKDALVFNMAVPGTSSVNLDNVLDSYLDIHPYAEYVMVHQGGNNINSSGNGMRPLTFDMLGNYYGVQQFVSSFVDIYTKILNRGKLPYVSRMHFRDYKDGTTAGQAANLPAVNQGRNQENGSLPYNLLLDSLTKIYAPTLYNNAEKRGTLNYYPISLNDQTIMGGDGIHPNQGALTENKLIDYWVTFVINNVYTGNFTTPLVYLPGPVNTCSSGTPALQDPTCWQSYFNGGVNTLTGIPRSPANKTNLLTLVGIAVDLAKKTGAGVDIWNARILVEQIGNSAIRVPYVYVLDSIRDYRTPTSPSNLSVFVVSSSALNLSWFRNSLNNSGFEIWRSSTSTGTNYRRVATITASGTTSFLDTGLSGDTIYYYYVKATNNGYSSGWSNIVNARPSSTYYAKSIGDLTTISSWGLNIDGSGNFPLNFTSPGQTFIVGNRGGVTTLLNNWSVTGALSKVVIASGNTLNTASNYNLYATVDVMDHASLGIYGSVNPTIGYVDTTSVISFGNSTTIPNKVYGNLNFIGSGNRILPAGGLDVHGNISLDPGIALQGTNATSLLNLYNSSFAFGDATASLNNISINLIKNTSTFDAKSGIFNLNNLTLSGNSTLNLINSSNLSVGSNGGLGLIINSGSTLSINNGNLSITGNAGLNSSLTGFGKIASSAGSIYFSTTNSTKKVHNLLMDDTYNKLNNLTINLGTASDTVRILSSLNISNTVKLSNGFLKTNDYLTLISNTANTARISKVEANARLVGKITSQRLVGPFKTQSAFMLATPVLNQTLSSWANFIALQGLSSTVNGVATILGKTNSVFTWNEPKSVWSGISNQSTSLQPGIGYRVTLKTSDLSSDYNSGFYANTGSPVVGDITGNPSNSFVFPLKNSSASGGWNLIANPYPSELDWDAVGGWDKTGIDNLYYVWDGVVKSYKVYVGATNTTSGVSSSGMTSIINSGQGFLVYAKNSGTSSISVNENAKIEVSSLPNFYREGNTNNIFRLFLSNNTGDIDEAILRFIDNATEEYDEQIDALKFKGESLNIATITPEKYDLVVNSLPFRSYLSIPVAVHSIASGGHKLTFKGIESLEKGSVVYLKDKFKNSLTDIRNVSSYDFEISDDTLSAGNGRFELQFFNNTISETKISGLYVYQNIPNPASTNTSIKFELPKADVVEFEVHNSIGQLVEKRTQQFEQGLNKFDVDLSQNSYLGSHEGIFYYSITANGTRVTKKMIVLK